MKDDKLRIWTLLVVILTSCPALADKGGMGNWGGSWQGGGSWQVPVENIPKNFAAPVKGGQWNILRQELQPIPQQIKRDYNQFQREQRQLFQQNWKRIKK